MFRGPHFQKQIFDNSTGSAIPNVKGVKDLKAIPIPLPPLAEQKAVVETINTALHHHKLLDTGIEDTTNKLTLLDQSILAKAFRGELVPQDPNDEPASVLLKRIQAEREAEQGKG